MVTEDQAPTSAPTLPIGASWEIPDPTTVTRPDGTPVQVVGGAFILTEPGTYSAEGGATVTAVSS